MAGVCLFLSVSRLYLYIRHGQYYTTTLFIETILGSDVDEVFSVLNGNIQRKRSLFHPDIGHAEILQNNDPG